MRGNGEYPQTQLALPTEAVSAAETDESLSLDPAAAQKVVTTVESLAGETRKNNSIGLR